MYYNDGRVDNVGNWHPGRPCPPNMNFILAIFRVLFLLLIRKFNARRCKFSRLIREARIETLVGGIFTVRIDADESQTKAFRVYWLRNNIRTPFWVLEFLTTFIWSSDSECSAETSPYRKWSQAIKLQNKISKKKTAPNTTIMHIRYMTLYSICMFDMHVRFAYSMGMFNNYWICL